MLSSNNRRPLSLATVLCELLMIFSSGGWIMETVSQQSGLQVNYYAQSCPNAESIALQTLQSNLFLDPTAPAALLRLVFHDCQVQGCDASVLLESPESEMVSDRSFGIRRLDFISKIKAALEFACPATVSCADIIVMAGRDAVALTGGPDIQIQTGRRDGLSGSNLRADNDLPSALINVDGLLQVFATKGLSIEESVAIVGGGHTLGIAHCLSFVNRLYPQPDPRMNPFLANTLKLVCPPPTFFFSNLTFFPNDFTNIIFDNQYFRDLQSGQGLMTIDSEIASDPRTSAIVGLFAANQGFFYQTFSSAYLKLTTTQTLTGLDGEIRNDCRFTNKPS